MKFSVLMLCYNPILAKAINTIYSIIIQKDVDFELIICDDGSEKDYLIEMESFLLQQHFKNYTIVKNKNNQGTVNNIISGLKEVSGEYVVLISPGDYLYNESTLYITKQFIDNNDAEIVFGDYVPYSKMDERYLFYSPIYDPKNKHCYDEKIQYNIDEIIDNVWKNNDRICGATICYKCELLKKYIQILRQNNVVYLEDLTINIACLERIRIWRIPTYTRWYECNTGISYKYNSFSDKINKDWENICLYVDKNYENPVAIRSARKILNRLAFKQKWNRGLFKIAFIIWNVMTNHRKLKNLSEEQYDFETYYLKKIEDNREKQCYDIK